MLQIIHLLILLLQIKFISLHLLLRLEVIVGNVQAEKHMLGLHRLSAVSWHSLQLSYLLIHI